YLFNSYYNAIGDRLAQPRRGLLSRPSAEEVYHYRAHVDAAMRELLDRPELPAEAHERTLLGLNHEQQHQELMLTDVKHALACNPVRTSYRDRPAPEARDVSPLRWLSIGGEIGWIGHPGDGFCFDNERPQHQVVIGPFLLADRLATCGEYLAFMEDGGYERPEWWLSDGLDAGQVHGWRAPPYWKQQDGQWGRPT